MVARSVAMKTNTVTLPAFCNPSSTSQYVLREEPFGGFDTADENHGTAMHEHGTFATWVATFVDIFSTSRFQ